MIETIRSERVLLKRIKNRKTINKNDSLITRDPYLIEDLKNKGLVKICNRKHIIDKHGISTISDFDYALTSEGIHFFQKRHEEFKNFLFRSLLIPIIVSVLTTLLTTQLIPFILKRMQLM